VGRWWGIAVGSLRAYQSRKIKDLRTATQGIRVPPTPAVPSHDSGDPGGGTMKAPENAEPLEVIHDSEWVTVWYHPEAKVVHHKFHKALRGEAFRSALLAGSAVLAQRGAKKWLSDNRLVFILPQDDQEWAKTVWFPQTLKMGWKYWAITKSEKAVVDLYLRRLAAGYSAAGVLTELFDLPEEGLAWLAKQGE
jgi:hypothetical protein